MKAAAAASAQLITVAIAAGPWSVSAAESRAEVQINLCTPPDQLQRALNLKADPRKTTVWLFDTPALSLQRAGLRLRLRERGQDGELTLKVAGQDCEVMVRATAGTSDKCETDVHGDALDDVVSLNRTIAASERSALTATASRGPELARALAAALSATQRSQLVAQRIGSAAMPVPAEIVRLGPSTVVRLTNKAQPYVVEVWTLPGGQQFTEISQKVARAVAFERRDELIRHLNARAVTVCADQASQAEHKFDALLR